MGFDAIQYQLCVDWRDHMVAIVGSSNRLVGVKKKATQTVNFYKIYIPWLDK